jgi:hypothetical protein
MSIAALSKYKVCLHWFWQVVKVMVCFCLTWIMLIFHSYALDFWIEVRILLWEKLGMRRVFDWIVRVFIEVCKNMRDYAGLCMIMYDYVGVCEIF